MLISVANLKEQYDKFTNFDDELIENKLKAIEIAIRNYTNNKFQNRYIRFIADVENGAIKGGSPYIVEGDTLEVSEGINKGLYVVDSFNDIMIQTKELLYNSTDNIFTKVEYPLDIVEGAIDLLDWELIKKGKDNTGIASETISRHSVSYVQKTNDNTVSGYPIELFNFCEGYKVMRT